MSASMTDACGEFIAMLIPMMMPVPVDSASLQDRVQRLEGTVLLLLEVIQSLVEHGDGKLGPGVVGDRLRALASVASEADAAVVVEAIGSEIKSGNQPGAVRKVRDEVGCTWDQAMQFVGQWQSMPSKNRIRIVRLAKMMRCLENAPGSR